MAPKRLSAMQRWGREFARARDEAGFTQVSLAQHPDVHVSHQTISHWELGLKRPKIDDLRGCQQAMGVRHLERILLEWVSLEVSPEWAEWMDVEVDASELLTYETRVIPGLLQTEAYAQAILSPDKVEQRMERQQVLHEGSPPFLEVLLDESVLHRMVGSPAVMADALNHLVRMSERDDIVVRIVPFMTGLSTLTLSFVLATVDSGKQVAYLDGPLRGRITERRSDIVDLRRIWGQTGAEALPKQESINLIQKVIGERWAV